MRIAVLRHLFKNKYRPANVQKRQFDCEEYAKERIQKRIKKQAAASTRAKPKRR
jgi:hypothetical protein